MNAEPARKADAPLEQLAAFGKPRLPSAEQPCRAEASVNRQFTTTSRRFPRLTPVLAVFA